MSGLTIKTGSTETFFKRGRKLARLADAGRPLPEECVISFEDPAEFLQLLTAARLKLFRAIKDQPGSITAISERLRRSRSAVKRDVDALARIGLVQIEVKVLPGHGRMKEVSAAAECVLLQAEVA